MKENETKLRKTEKNMEKENNTDESDFSENEIPHLNSLKPFKFEPKTNIGDINSSSSDDEVEDIEYKVCEKGVFRNFAKFTGKHLCQSLCFNKVAGVRPLVAASVNSVKQ